MPRKSCVEHNFCIDVNCGVEPCVLFIFELDLFFIDGDTIWLGGELLLIVLGGLDISDGSWLGVNRRRTTHRGLDTPLARLIQHEQRTPS